MGESRNTRKAACPQRRVRADDATSITGAPNRSVPEDEATTVSSQEGTPIPRFDIHPLHEDQGAKGGSPEPVFTFYLDEVEEVVKHIAACEEMSLGFRVETHWTRVGAGLDESAYERTWIFEVFTDAPYPDQLFPE